MNYVVEVIKGEYAPDGRSLYGPFPGYEHARRWAERHYANSDGLAARTYMVLPVLKPEAA